MTDLRPLLARLEEATGPSREIDQDIYFELGTPRIVDGYAAVFESPQYTSSIDASLALVEKKLPDWVLYSFGNGDLDLKYRDIRRFTNWKCGLARSGARIATTDDVLRYPTTYAATAPLAILIALLRALISNQTDPGKDDA